MQDKGGWRGAFCMPHHTDAGVLAFRWGRLAAEASGHLAATTFCASSSCHCAVP